MTINTKLIKDNYGYILIILFALAVRSIWIFFVPIAPVSDCHVYDLAARNLAQGNGYCITPGEPLAAWPPGTSFIYSLIYRIFGFSYSAVALFNLAISIGSVILTMALAQRWFGRKASIISGIIIAAYLNNIAYTTIMASDPLCVFFILSALWIWTSPHTNQIKKSVITGLLLGVATYVRSNMLLLPVIFGLTYLAEKKDWRGFFFCTTIMAIVVVILITPWVIRNSRIFNKPTLSISLNFGGVLWQGNNPASSGGGQDLPKMQWKDLREQDQWLCREAVSYILKYPFKFIGRSIFKFAGLHKQETSGIVWNSKGLAGLSAAALLNLKLFSTLSWWLVLLCGIWGVYILIKEIGFKMAVLHPAVMLWLYISVTHSIILIDPRYKFLFFPMVAILAGFALSKKWLLKK